MARSNKIYPDIDVAVSSCLQGEVQYGYLNMSSVWFAQVFVRGHTDKPISAYTSCCVRNESDLLQVLSWRIRGMLLEISGAQLFLDDEDVVSARQKQLHRTHISEWSLVLLYNNSILPKYLGACVSQTRTLLSTLSP